MKKGGGGDIGTVFVVGLLEAFLLTFSKETYNNYLLTKKFKAREEEPSKKPPFLHAQGK